MKAREKIQLTGEQETLLVPLYCKTNECGSILSDPKAQGIVQQITYNFSELNIPRKTCLMLCLRARQFDQYTREFLEKYEQCLVLHLGCGLDSRYVRLQAPLIPWYDLDMPPVITLRRHFYQETANYHMVASSVTDLSWVREVPVTKQPVLILAEGLTMYLTEEDMRALVQTLVQKFSTGAFIFDAFSILTAKHAKTHPSLHQTGAQTHWGLNDPRLLEQWTDAIHFHEEWAFTQSRRLSTLHWRDRFPFQIAGLFSAARRAHRILYYTFGTENAI